jgi:hypothetical protein
MGKNQFGERTDVLCGERKGPVIKYLRETYPDLDWEYELFNGCPHWKSSAGWGVMPMSNPEESSTHYIRTDNLKPIPELGIRYWGEPRSTVKP